MMRFQVNEKKLAQIFTLIQLKSFLFLISVLESTANVNWLHFLISNIMLQRGTFQNCVFLLFFIRQTDLHDLLVYFLLRIML